MGCSQPRRSDVDEEAIMLYPSALIDSDSEILALWNKFLRGECPAWKKLREEASPDDPMLRPTTTPVVYWHNICKENIINNISISLPTLAAELQSRHIRGTSHILASMMELILIHVISAKAVKQHSFSSTEFHVGDRMWCSIFRKRKRRKSGDSLRHSNHSRHSDDTNLNEEDENIQRRMHKMQKIARHHCKWGIEDDSYILVENAVVDALRVCLGTEFRPQHEVRVRYKYALIKKMIQQEELRFVAEHPEVAEKLRREGKLRISQLHEEMQRQKLESQTKQTESKDQLNNGEDVETDDSEEASFASSSNKKVTERTSHVNVSGI